MRACPVCDSYLRNEVFRMQYCIPDAWPLPSQIIWNECQECGMIYGDGDFTQSMLNDYYQRFYGYGLNGQANVERLKADAEWIARNFPPNSLIVDFGGEGDEGKSVLIEALKEKGFTNALCKGPDEYLPCQCDVIYASHVLEHIYELQPVINDLVSALKASGTLIVDIPEATGILLHWNKAILDYNTKHINHFTMRTMLNLAFNYGLEMVDHKPYVLDGAPCVQIQFKKMDVAEGAKAHIEAEAEKTLNKLKQYTEPVNLWGLNDRVWSIIDRTNLNILDYIDNDPAYRGRTYRGKPVQERPTNDAPILVICQGQAKQLLSNIAKMNLKNKVIEI